jgi:hypothetical protein
VSKIKSFLVNFYATAIAKGLTTEAEMNEIIKVATEEHVYQMLRKAIDRDLRNLKSQPSAP